MIPRFARIKNEFGTMLLLRVLLLLFGLVGMSLLGWFALEISWPALVSLLGLLIGWLLRGAIVDHGKTLTRALPVGLTVFGILLFISERTLDISRETQLLAITLTTVTIFNIQFWWLSDPEVINIKQAEN